MTPIVNSNTTETQAQFLLNTGDFKLSEIWNRCHPHLKPFDNILPLPKTQYQTCPLCQSEQAIEVVAHLGFGPDYWVKNGRVHYCLNCQEYTLPDKRYQEYVAQALAWAQQSERKEDYSQLWRVDARLWSVTQKALQLDPTNRCNFSCWYCMGRHMEEKDLSFEEFAKILDHCPSLEVLVMTGDGEPLMNKAFFDMVRLAKQRHIWVMIASNGSTFSTSNVKKICESGLNYIGISIDSADPETFAQLRIGGDLPQVLNGIKRLSSYRDEHGYKYPLLGVRGISFKQTKEQLAEIVQLAKEHGVDVVDTFQPLNPKVSYIEHYPEDKKALLDINDGYMSSVNKAFETNILPTFPQLLERENIHLDLAPKPNGIRSNCDIPTMFLQPSGNLLPCALFEAPQDTHWNLINSSLESILKNEHYERTRFNLWNGLFPSCCKGCWPTRPLLSEQ